MTVRLKLNKNFLAFKTQLALELDDLKNKLRSSKYTEYSNLQQFPADIELTLDEVLILYQKLTDLENELAKEEHKKAKKKLFLGLHQLKQHLAAGMHQSLEQLKKKAQLIQVQVQVQEDEALLQQNDDSNNQPQQNLLQEQQPTTNINRAADNNQPNQRQELNNQQAYIEEEEEKKHKTGIFRWILLGFIGFGGVILHAFEGVGVAVSLQLLITFIPFLAIATLATFFAIINIIILVGFELNKLGNKLGTGYLNGKKILSVYTAQEDTLTKYIDLNETVVGSFKEMTEEDRAEFEEHQKFTKLMLQNSKTQKERLRDDTKNTLESWPIKGIKLFLSMVAAVIFGGDAFFLVCEGLIFLLPHLSSYFVSVGLVGATIKGVAVGLFFLAASNPVALGIILGLSILAAIAAVAFYRLVEQTGIPKLVDGLAGYPGKIVNKLTDPDKESQQNQNSAKVSARLKEQKDLLKQNVQSENVRKNVNTELKNKPKIVKMTKEDLNRFFPTNHKQENYKQENHKAKRKSEELKRSTSCPNLKKKLKSHF